MRMNTNYQFQLNNEKLKKILNKYRIKDNLLLKVLVKTNKDHHHHQLFYLYVNQKHLVRVEAY
jgi:hypothetical protein